MPQNCLLFTTGVHSPIPIPPMAVFSIQAGRSGFPGPLTFTAVIASYPANLSLLAVLSTIRHFFDIDESQARDPSARKRLSKIAGLM